MPHFKVSDDSHSHPKAIMAGDAAWGMWNRAGCWSMAYGTDGFVPEWWVKQQPQGAAKARALIGAQLWSRGQYEGGRPEYQGQKGYTFHEWRQDTYGKVEADREKWRRKKADQRSSPRPMSPGDNGGDKTGDTPGDSRESPGYIPNTQYPKNSGYVPGSATDPNANAAPDDAPPEPPGAAAISATPGADLVRQVIPDTLPNATRTALRLQANALLKAGSQRADVLDALRDWLTKTGVGPGVLPSLVADVVKRRTGYGEHIAASSAPRQSTADLRVAQAQALKTTSNRLELA